MTGIIILSWVFGAAGVFHILLSAYRECPDDMPGGGVPAVVAIAVCWPLLLVLGAIGLVLYGISETL